MNNPDTYNEEKDESNISNIRMTRRNFIKLVGGVVVVAAAATAAGFGTGLIKLGGQQTTQTATATRGGTLTVAIDSDIVRLDPHASTAAVDRVMYQSLYDHFVDLDVNSNIVPAIAESWTQPDAVTYIFTIRDGVKFQDGTMLDADAVKFNFDRMMGLLDKSLLPNPNARASEVSPIQSVSVIDSRTVKFTLKQPFAPFLSVLTDRAGMFVSPTALQKDPQGFLKHPVGAGPFSFVEWVPGDHVTLKRFDNYYRQGLPYLDQVTIRPVTDGTTRLLDLESGSVDFIRFFNDSDLSKVKNDAASGKLQYVINPSYGFQGAFGMLNTTKPPFNNQAARQAILYAIDVQAYVDTITFGVESPINGPITPAHGAYYDPTFKPFDKWPHSDTTLARQALQQAGLANGFTFEYKTVSTQLARQIAELWQAQLASVGITMNIVQEDFTTLLSDTQNGNYQAAGVGWSGRPDPDQNVYIWFHTGASFNQMGYSNPTVDSLLEQARASTSTSERVSLYQRAVRQIVMDAPYIFTTAFPNDFAWLPNVKGFVPVPDGMVRTATMYKT